jgi:hypothetical protein
MASSELPPLELQERDLELLAPTRARDAEWNPQRLEVRRRLGALGAALALRLQQETGVALEGHTSLHHPASFNAFRVDQLRLYLTRDRKARTALGRVLGSSFRKDVDSAYRHVLLQVSVAQPHVQVELSIHPEAWWDAQNLLGKTTRGEGAGQLAALLNQATSFALQIHEHREHQAGRIYRDQLERALQHFRVGEHYLRFFRRRPREEILALDPQALSRQLYEDLLLLVPAYSWIAWSPANQCLFPGGSS